MTTIAPDWLAAPATRRVMTALAPAGPLFVGGCVRDALMRRATGDIDIAVGTPPEETMALVEGAGLRAHPTGIEHGVITVSVAGDDGTGAAAFEVATFRRDVATDGRRAVVAFTADVTEDAARRDFTMNALYARTDGAVIDPLGAGLHDLAARRLRFVGDADTRIAEDYLRILRFFRFHAQFEIQAFDSAGLEACCAGAPGLARISRERIGAEIIKLLAAPDPGPALTAMGPVLPMILEGADAAAVSALTAAEARLDLAPDPLRRLFALGLAPHAAQTALRLSNAATARLKAIGDAIERAESAGGLAAAAYRVGGDAAADAAALRASAGHAPPKDWRNRVERGVAAVFPITAADLQRRGIAPGPELGRTLKALESNWAASGFTRDAAQLLEDVDPAGPSSLTS